MKPRNMRWYLTWYLLAFTGIMALVYGVLMNYYLYNGLEAEASYDLKVYADQFEKAYWTDPGIQPLRVSTLSGSISGFLGEETLPEKYRSLFPATNYRNRKLMFSFEHPGARKEDRGDVIFFMPYRLHDGRQLFVVEIEDQAYNHLFDGPRIDRLYYSTIPIGILFVAAFFLVLRFILNRLRRPTENLFTWAQKLDAGSLDKPVPDFGYQETNEMAQLIHTSLKDLSETLEKEQLFLRNASHELRTPVAIVQSNAELMTRMNPEASGPESLPVRRILKAAVNMNRLIETLLWLAMEGHREPPVEVVALDALAREVVDENRYLLDGKQVSVRLDLGPSSVTTVAHAARITLGNLIRNAFQYTVRGRVIIAVVDGTVTVTNENHQEINNGDYGFGLGLALVEQLSAKSGWHYDSHPVQGGRKAWVTFSSPPDKTDHTPEF